MRRLAAIVVACLIVIPSVTFAQGHIAPSAIVSRQAAAPVFSFPTNGTSYPSNGSYVFQVQPVSGAKGYLWSFVQNGMIVYQNLAWDGRLSPANYTVSTSSKAHRLIHSGDLHVWVRALVKNGQWSATGAVLVRIQGKGGPSPNPTTVPKPSNVLYQANWSGGFNGWSGTQDWKTVDGMLVNDGTHRNWRLSIVAPYQPTGIDYAVQAEIQVINVGGCSSFGLVARAPQSSGFGDSTDTNGIQGGVNYCEFKGANIWDVPVNHTNYDPGTTWHTYRLEVKGNNIRFLIDGAPQLTATDNRYLSPGSMGLWCDTTQLNVRSFKVLKL